MMDLYPTTPTQGTYPAADQAVTTGQPRTCIRNSKGQDMGGYTPPPRGYAPTTLADDVRSRDKYILT